MLEIVATSYNNAPLAGVLAARFGAEGGTIGRSDDNLLVLPDPKHHVSRFQARIVSAGAQHAITNLSQANPTRLNGVELPCDIACPLQVQDEICIGLYVLKVQAVISMPSIVMSHSVVMQAPLAVASAPVSLEAVRGAAVRAPAGAGTRTNDGTRVNPGVNICVQARAPGAVQLLADVTPNTAANPDGQALLQAFLDGAGIPSITLSTGLTPELMHMVGTLLACAVDGTVDLIGMRALVKREVNADLTMVVVRNNNPLKFLPDGATVLTQMLRKRMPGFMTPVEAMHDAYDDLHAHQLGLMAGMQATVLALQAQLDPQAIESATPPATLLERLLPAGRQARMWQRYCTLHESTGRGLRAELSAHAGKPFLSAYEAASERYRDEAANGR
jgi:FHA domain-containing protein